MDGQNQREADYFNTVVKALYPNVLPTSAGGPYTYVIESGGYTVPLEFQVQLRLAQIGIMWPVKPKWYQVWRWFDYRERKLIYDDTVTAIIQQKQSIMRQLRHDYGLT